MGPADKTRICELQREFLKFNKENVHSKNDLLLDLCAVLDEEELINTDFDNFLNKIGFVAEEDGIIKGYIIGSIDLAPYRKYKKTGNIEECFVTEFDRKRGIGKILFSSLVDEFKIEGCDRLRVSAYLANDIAVSSYKKMGFIEGSIDLLMKLDK